MSSKGSLNKVMIIGNLGADPELRTLPSGVSVSNFSVATSESWIDKNSGERTEETEWHRVSLFGRQAEVLHQYGRKGKKIYVEGTLRTQKWTDKDGNDRYTTEIRGREFTFLSARSDEGGGGGSSSGGEAKKDQSAGGFDDMGEDDIPF